MSVTIYREKKNTIFIKNNFKNSYYKYYLKDTCNNRQYFQSLSLGYHTYPIKYFQ